MTWKRVAIYARVSKDGQTVEQQVAALRAWLCGRAETLVVFTEKKSSRKARPVKEEMLRRARAGEFSAIAVWKFDRFARSARELVMWLDEAQGLGLDFVSCTEGLDTSTAMGKAVFTILAAVAELERSLISERTRARLDFLRAKGVRLGRPRKHFDQDQAERLVLEKGLTSRQLAKALGVSRTTARRIRDDIQKHLYAELADLSQVASTPELAAHKKERLRTLRTFQALEAKKMRDRFEACKPLDSKELAKTIVEVESLRRRMGQKGGASERAGEARGDDDASNEPEGRRK